MTNEDWITTSEIAALLNHKSAAATRSWIRNHQPLKVQARDTDTGEKKYSRSDVLAQIAKMPRGPYEKARPDKEPPHVRDPGPDQRPSG